MEIPEIFEELSKSTKSKSIKSLTKKLSQKFNTDNPEVLENICKLAYILYIYGDNNSAKTVESSPENSSDYKYKIIANFKKGSHEKVKI